MPPSSLSDRNFQATVRAFRNFRRQWVEHRLKKAAARFVQALERRANFNPNQPRVPAGNPDGGQWADEGSESGFGLEDAWDFDDPDELKPIPVSGRGRGRHLPRFPGATPSQQARLEVAHGQARQAIADVRRLDPAWRPRPSATSRDIEGAIARFEGERAEAEARFNEITRDAVPGANPFWGVTRLKKFLYNEGYRLERKTRSAGVQLYNPITGETIRIMERPIIKLYRNEQREKRYFDYYYRYRGSKWDSQGNAIPIPNTGNRNKN